MGNTKRLATAGLLAVALIANGCARSALRQASPVDRSRGAASAAPTVEWDEASRQPGTGADFSGSWSVQWCDKTEPEADCGGFHIDLAQVGDEISGEAFGARVRLTQIDEGGIIHGVAVGNTAILTIESQRSGGIYLIEATVEGDRMRWKMRRTVRAAEQDIDIIASDDVLTRKAVHQRPR